MEPEAAHQAAAEPTDTPHEVAIAAEGQRPDEATPHRAAAAAAEGAAAAAAGASPAADRYSDADLDGLALKLDAHSHQMRADLLAHLADCQRRAEERQRAAVAAVASSAARELATKEQELACTTAELERQREMLRRTGEALFKAARWRWQHMLGCMAWRAWRERAARQSRIKAVAATASDYDGKRRQRGAFRAWRAEAASQLRLRVKAQAAATLQEERARIWEEAHASGAQKAKRLAEVEAALAAALEERARLEEKMKRAFMRGVCALNLEAMALMKGGGLPQGGPAAPSMHADPGSLEQATCVPAAGQQVGQEETIGQAAAVDQAQQQQLREQLLDKLLQTGAAGGAAPGWSIGTSGLRMLASMPLTTSVAPAAAAAGPISSSGAGSTARAHIMPDPEQPRPIITLAPTNAVPTVPQLPPNVPRAAERHSVTGARPGTAVPVPCSLPSNVPPHIAARRGAASPARPATAPQRRQQAAAAAAVHARQQQPQQPQQVSRRSLAGQAREGAGPTKTGQPLVVRSAAGMVAGRS